MDRIRQAIRRALSLIDDLHELGRAETGHVAIHLARTNLAELVTGLGEEYRATADEKRLRFVVEIDPALPSIDTDAGRISQIVGNLLSNAIKYTDAGVVTLSARTVVPNDADGGRSFAIDVSDTGPGIPRDQLGRLFQEFVRAENQPKPGAGLGLAISKLLADALGCQIHVTSELGKGSTFSLRIPASETSRCPRATAASD